MQPTKLPDELFPDDEWLAADYAGRVALLLVRYHASANEAREAWEKVSLAMAERDTVRADAKDLRERNAQLAKDLEETGAVNARLLKQLAHQLAEGVYAETKQPTTGQ